MRAFVAETAGLSSEQHPGRMVLHTSLRSKVSFEWTTIPTAPKRPRTERAKLSTGSDRLGGSACLNMLLLHCNELATRARHHRCPGSSHRDPGRGNSKHGQ